MFRRLWLILFLFCVIVFPTHPAEAISFVSNSIFRDNIVYEPGAFTGVIDSDTMKVSTVLGGVTSPNDYMVHLTSGSPLSLDTYLHAYRDRGGLSWEYVNGPLPDPGSTWEDISYTFQAVLSSDLSSVTTTGPTSFYIPSGSVSNPINTPDWVSFSGDLLNPTISWDSTLGSGEGTYSLRLYALNPDGSFDYSIIGYSAYVGASTLYSLTGYTMELGKSYAIGIQSNITDAGGNLLDRSQYYVRYDTTPVPEPTTMLLLGTGLLGLAGLGMKKFKKS